ncbi:MAG: hypothetical protein HYR56_13490 [Acidobacteria bacterium]|nr:hypothetical protein [Acidobacteriota bacterium]MBI3423983.1 hypothetical protein [Acidobacteriota bacterium]
MHAVQAIEEKKQQQKAPEIYGGLHHLVTNPDCVADQEARDVRLVAVCDARFSGEPPNKRGGSLAIRDRKSSTKSRVFQRVEHP